VALCIAAASPAAAALPATPTVDGAGGTGAQRMVEVFAEDGAISRISVPVEPDIALPRAEQAALAASTVTPLHQSGPSSNRLDIVILGDGYTEAQLGLFHQHAEAKWRDISGTEPFTTYASYFNVWMVDVVSPQSGVDNDPTPPTQRDTALDMQFWCNGTERLLCVNQTKAQAAAAAAPGVDQILVLANSSKYGGAGGGVATSSGGNTAAGLITVHELGHSLGGLADEYDYYYRAGLAEDSTQDVTIPAPYLYYPGAALGEPSGVNTTAEADTARMAANKLKWWRWLGTPAAEGGVVGAYEGSGYYRYGQYRPTPDSLMHSLGIPKGGNEFNAPSSEEMVRQFYRKVRPIDAVSPAATALQAGDIAGVEVLQPSGHSLDVRWYLDGAEITTAANALQVPITDEMAAQHSALTVTVADPTAFVRNPDYQATQLTQTHRWDL
jgi:hypothetical protein